MTATLAPQSSTNKLPKYLQRANQILQILTQQPDQTWARPQRELGEVLGISQPQLSALLKYLFENERIRRGSPMPGVRGKNYKIVLVDDTPFGTGAPRAAHPHLPETEDRPLAPDETVAGVMDLGQITVEQIGAGVLRALQQSWRSEARNAELRAESITRLREFREQLTNERRLRSQLVTEKEDLQRRLHDLEHIQTELRTQINNLLVRSNGHDGDGRGKYRMGDLMDEESLRVFRALLTEKPGHYRESDAEIGLDSGV